MYHRTWEYFDNGILQSESFWKLRCNGVFGYKGRGGMLPSGLYCQEMENNSNWKLKM